MLSPFQQRKLILSYYRWDTVKDGLVRASDFENFGQRVAANLGVDPSSEQYENILNGARGIWNAYWKSLDSDADGSVTLQEVLTAMEMAFQMANLADNAEFAKQTNRQIIAALDANGNGEVSLKEYCAFVGAMGVDEEDASKAFSKLDRNGNGVLSADEVALAWAYYIASDDPADPSNWFFGEF